MINVYTTEDNVVNVYSTEEGVSVEVDGAVVPVGGVTPVQSDHNENDPESPAYIKNRTHWVENNETVLFPETKFTNLNTMATANYSGSTELLVFAPVVGETYNVYWNGNPYEIVAENPYGNMIYLNVTATEEIPFSIRWDVGYNGAALKAYSNPVATLKITKGGEVVHRLDKKFLPSGEANQMFVTDADGNVELEKRTHYPYYVHGELLPEMIVDSAGMDYNRVNVSENMKSKIVAGKSYTVTWNGTPYKVVAESAGDDAAVLDHYNPAFIVHYTNGETFVNMKENEAALIRIEGPVVAYKKLDREYLPDDIGGGEPATDEEVLETLMESDLLNVVYDESGILADENNNILEW